MDPFVPSARHQRNALSAFRARWGEDSDEAAIATACAATTAGAGDLGAVDPVAVAESHGAKVLVRPWGPRAAAEHGALSVVSQRWQVEVPSEMTAERRRFSIAHEIGHILLLEAVASDPALVRELGGTAIRGHVERLCNLAAAHLLMPTATMTRHLSKHPELDEATLPELAHHFYVSYEAMARRISEVSGRWRLTIWEWTTDHPKGPAWRTSKVQDRIGARSFVPAGMSSKRLFPDVVARAAEQGFGGAGTVRFDSRTPTVLFDARAWRNRRSSRLQLAPDEDQQAPTTPKIFLLARGG